MMLTNILEKCKEKGLTLAELERQAGLANRTIYKWDENVPSVDKVVAVAKALDVTVDELVKKEGE
jgi:transcriptional regulator with XRE-family HTH domain